MCNSNEVTSHWANKLNQASHPKTDAAVSHLYCLSPLLLHHDWNNRERDGGRCTGEGARTFSSPPPLTHTPHPLTPWFQREERGGDSQHRLSSPLPQTFLCSQFTRERGWQEALGLKPHTHMQAQAHIYFLTYSTHACVHAHPHTHTVLGAQGSLIFSSNHPLSATAAFTANCPYVHHSVCACDYVCVCVCTCVWVCAWNSTSGFVAEQHVLSDSAPNIAMVAALLICLTHPASLRLL